MARMSKVSAQTLNDCAARLLAAEHDANEQLKVVQQFAKDADIPKMLAAVNKRDKILRQASEDMKVLSSTIRLYAMAQNAPVNTIVELWRTLAKNVAEVVSVVNEQKETLRENAKKSVVNRVMADKETSAK